MAIKRNGDSLPDDTGAVIGSVLFGPDHSVTFMAAPGMRFDHQSLWEISKFIEPMTEPLIHRDQGDVAVAESEDDRLRVVARSATLFRGDAGPDSKPVGSIGLDGLFTPAPGVDFSHQELRDISNRVRAQQRRKHYRRGA
jgi:hypothetical protein